MSLILYSSDGLVTRMNEQSGLPDSFPQTLMCLLADDIGPSLLAAAYRAGGIVFATPESIFHFEDGLDARDPIVTPLVDRIGRARSLELLINAKELDSAEASLLGIIDGVASIAEFEDKIAEISTLSKSSMIQAALLVRRQKGLTAKQAMLLERYNFALRFASADQKEGIDAFLKKRKPEFS